MTYGLGVDLGTTWTAAAVGRGGNVRILRLGGQRPEIPSVLFLPADGPVVVGEAAARRGEGEPDRLASEFKRRVGDPVPLLIGGSPYPAHALLARQLEHAFAAATAAEQGPPGSVVLTCPANWGPYKRDLLEQAARLADAPQLTLRTEPEAAAISYAAGEHVSGGDVVAVYDLGGGTFDAAVLHRTTSGFEILGTPEGIEQLGGIDFDEAVFAHATRDLPPDRMAGDDPELLTALARLRHDCVQAKEALSFDTEVMIPVALPGLHTRIRLTRGEFETMVAPSLQETVRALGRALRSAEIEPRRLRAVLMAGGSSRIPLAGALVGEAFGRPVVIDPNPEHSIALGAALLTGSTAESTARAAVRPPPPSTLPPQQTSQQRIPPPSIPPPSIPPLSITPPRPGTAVRRPRRNGRLVATAAAVVLAAGGIPAAIWLSHRPDSAADGAAGSPAAVDSASAAGSPACGFTEDFTGDTLDRAWQRTRTDLNVTVAGGVAEVDVPDGNDLLAPNTSAPKLLRTVTGDFDLEATVEATPAVFYQGAGLLLWNGPASYVRIERGFGTTGTVNFEYEDGGPYQRLHGSFKSQDPIKAAATRFVLRMSRTGDKVSGSWRPADRPDFAALATARLSLPPRVQVGVAVVNQAQPGSTPAAFSARFDRITLTCRSTSS